MTNKCRDALHSLVGYDGGNHTIRLIQNIESKVVNEQQKRNRKKWTKKQNAHFTGLMDRRDPLKREHDKEKIHFGTVLSNT